MKKILLILLVLIVGCAKEPEGVNIDTLEEKRGDIYYTKDTNEPFTGIVFSLFESGGKELEGYLKNGKLVKVTYYNEDGSIYKVEEYKDGELVE